MGLLDQLGSFAQGASNSIAGGVSAPVDGIAWLLRKAGVPVPSNPVGGSDWMSQQGLTAAPKNHMAGLLGEGIGGALPSVAAARAPQIARGLLQMGENAMMPSPLNKQAGMILFHGSNDSQPLRSVNPGQGLFGGVFASQNDRSALSHGDKLYRMTIPDEHVLTQHALDYEVPYEKASGFLKNKIRGDNVDDIADMVISGKDVWNSRIPENQLLHALSSDDLGEASWQIQQLRGQLSKHLGYKAVEMPDEHGTSYLVNSAINLRPSNDAAKSLFKK